MPPILSLYSEVAVSPIIAISTCLYKPYPFYSVCNYAVVGVPSSFLTFLSVTFSSLFGGRCTLVYIPGRRLLLDHPSVEIRPSVISRSTAKTVQDKPMVTMGELIGSHHRTPRGPSPSPYDQRTFPQTGGSRSKASILTLNTRHSCNKRS